MPACSGRSALGSESNPAAVYTRGIVADWDDQGVANPLPIITFTAPLNPLKDWWCRTTSGTSNSSFLISTPTCSMAGSPLHSTPPPEPLISILLPSSRQPGLFRLTYGDETVVPGGDTVSVYSPPLQSETLNGSDGMVDYPRAFLTLQFTTARPYGAPQVFLEEVTDPENPIRLPLYSQVNDRRDWLLPPEQVTLCISGSRCYHDLLIRHASGEALTLTKHSTQGDFSLTPDQLAWFTSYYYFDATAEVRSKVPWYVEDSFTGERIGPNPSDADLINWIALANPEGLRATEQDDGTFLLDWTFSETSQDAAFKLQRRENPGEPWLSIQTLLAAASFDPTTHRAASPPTSPPPGPASGPPSASTTNTAPAPPSPATPSRSSPEMLMGMDCRIGGK